MLASRDVAELDGRRALGERDYLLPSESQLRSYEGSATERASSLTRSGSNVSTITAVSSVRVSSIEASTLPGCGPWTKPAGWSVNEPAPIPAPFRLMKSPST